MLRSLALSLPALLLGACAITPLAPFPPDHPASPDAAEAPALPLQHRLTADEATERSAALLTAAERGNPAPAPPGQDAGAMPATPMGGSHENH